MDIVYVNKDNVEIFKKTYIISLKEGFDSFVPYKMIENLNNNFQSYYDEIEKK